VDCETAKQSAEKCDLATNEITMAIVIQHSLVIKGASFLGILEDSYLQQLEAFLILLMDDS
jgi:hypothetical protein